MSSTTAKTMSALRAEGYTVHRAEYFHYFAKKRFDMGGFGDVIAWRAEPPDILVVQATDMQHRGEHLKKIDENPKAAEWVKAGGRLELWSWRKLLVKRGGKAVRWKALREEIT
jgi:hypothetical protein